jgi:hypothetical protein
MPDPNWVLQLLFPQATATAAAEAMMAKVPVVTATAAKK